MDKIYIEVPEKEVRRIARTSLKGKWFPVFIGTVIYYILNECVPALINTVFSKELVIEIAGKSMPLNIGYVGGIYKLILGGALLAGYLMFLMVFFRSEKIEYALTFEGFGFFGKALLLYLLIVVKIALWSILFVIPGIIAGFRYSQSFFILLDDRELSASQCIERSKSLMAGNKAHAFFLSISFIGWAFLAALPKAFADVFMNVADNYEVLTNLIFELPMKFVGLYMGVTFVAFYEILSGNLEVEPQEVKTWEEQCKEKGN